MPHVVTDGTYSGLLPKVVLERIVVDAPPAKAQDFPFDCGAVIHAGRRVNSVE